MADGWRRSRNHWQGEVESLGRDLVQRPLASRPPLSRAGDPLATLDTAPRTERLPRTDRDLGRDIDFGLDR